MTRFTCVLALALLSLFVAGCGGGGGGGDGGGGGQGQIQVLNNMPTYFTEILVGPAGSSAPKADMLSGVLVSGGSILLPVAPGNYDVDVVPFSTGFAVIKHYTNIAVGDGEVQTIVVIP